MLVQVAEKDLLVTLGIQPRNRNRYGYIHQGELIDTLGNQQCTGLLNSWKNRMRRRHPLCAEWRYYWNSGIFTWQISTLREEYEHFQPRSPKRLSKIEKALGTPARVHPGACLEPRANRDNRRRIMEKSKRVAVLPIDVGWSDVGSWATLLDFCQQSRIQCVVGTTLE